MKNYIMKIILLGDTHTGKTNFLNTYIKECNDDNIPNMPTIGVDFGCKTIEISNDLSFKIQCWDTAGQESYRTIIRTYYRNSCGIILLFDLTNTKTFENLDIWLNDIKSYSICDHAHPILLLGTNSDKTDSRKISKHTAIQYANYNNLSYYELSTFDYDSIHRMMKIYLFKVYNTLKDTNCQGIKELKNNDNQNNNQNDNNILDFDNKNNNIDNDNDKDKTCCVIS